MEPCQSFAGEAGWYQMRALMGGDWSRGLEESVEHTAFNRPCAGNVVVAVSSRDDFFFGFYNAKPVPAWSKGEHNNKRNKGIAMRQ